MNPVDEIIKEPFDEFAYWFDFRKQLLSGEAPSSCALAAFDLSDGSDVTATLLASASGTLVTGTATGGDTGKMIQQGTNLLTSLVFPNDVLINKTRDWSAVVKKHSTTGQTANDTVHFEIQPSPASSGDLWALSKVRADLKGGANNKRYKIKATLTTDAGRKHEQVLLLNVIDN